jgi:hypothetical protein
MVRSPNIRSSPIAYPSRSAGIRTDPRVAMQYRDIPNNRSSRWRRIIEPQRIYGAVRLPDPRSSSE